jgi:sulfur carrier protein
MNILLNGKDYSIDKERNLSSFVKESNYNEDTVVIIKNAEIIKKELWDKTFLNENDRLEIFSFVGGG